MEPVHANNVLLSCLEKNVTKQASATASAPSPSVDLGGLAQRLEDAFLAVRNETERRAAPLSPEDQQIQSMPDASPTKWHRAHTTWFWEQFVLGEHYAGYQPFHPDFAFLFNSYYVSAGPRHSRNHRGDITRPSADQVGAYRKHVDAAVVKFFRDAGEDKLREIDGQWRVMTLAGFKPVDPDAPVCHVSYYEADAFARWAGKHLPTEMEWEVAARAGQLNDAFGIVWQWTRSSYSPYPGYRAVEGALGEYNGKFLSLIHI